MFNQLTYKRKNQLLIAAVVLTVYLMYSLAIKNTLMAYTQYNDNKAQLALAVNAPAKAKQLEQELEQINEKIGNQNINGKNTEQALLDLITNYCQNNRLTLREFPEAQLSQQGDLLIETNQFVVEGGFASLLNMVYVLEQKNKLGKIAGVRYQLKKDIQTKEMALTATVYLQNIKHGEHEE